MEFFTINNLLDTEKAINHVFGNLGKAVYDVESDGLISDGGVICHHGFGINDRYYTLPTNHSKLGLSLSNGRKNLPREEVLHLLVSGINTHKPILIGHNIAFDLTLLLREYYGRDAHKMAHSFFDGLEIHDTMVMYHVLDENGKKALKYLARNILKHDTSDEDELQREIADAYKSVENQLKTILKNKKIKIRSPEGKKFLEEGMKDYKNPYNYAHSSIQKCSLYCAKDVWRTEKLMERFIPAILPHKDLTQCYLMEMDVIKPTVCMQLAGLDLDREKLENLSNDVSYEVFQKEAEYHSFCASHGVYGDKGPTGRKKKQEIFEKLGYRFQKNEQTGNVVMDKNVMKGILTGKNSTPEQVYCAGLINQYNKISKLLSTYITPLLEYARTNDGRLYGSLKPTGTTTGRFSSSDPNLQNMPKKDKRIRSCILCPEDAYIISIDYKQMEMRLAGHFSGDPKLIKLFEENKDPYQYIAAVGEGIPYEAVSKDLRNFPYKSVCLAKLYGALLKKLLTMTPGAKEIISLFESEFPLLKELEEKLTFTWHQQGYINLLYGRRRRMEEEWMLYKQLNSLIQGSGAMIVKRAIIRCWNLLSKYKSYIALTVHDEIVFIVYKDELFLVPELKAIMEDFKTLVPLLVDVKVSNTNWGEGIEIEDMNLFLNGGIENVLQEFQGN